MKGVAEAAARAVAAAHAVARAVAATGSPWDVTVTRTSAALQVR